MELVARAVIAGDVGCPRTVASRPRAAVARGTAARRRGSTVCHRAFPAATFGSVIASNHSFATWEEYEAFALESRDETSLTARFEAAVDSVVRGDEATLERLLRAHPELVHSRSAASHHSTLLLYVGANGIEGFRQKTPKNAVRIAEILLAAGADVDAVGEMYRGTTTLGLVATSVHPVTTGVQEELISLLVGAGASLARAVAPDYTHGRVVNACLANGRGEGAELVAKRGAELDLEGAAGVGRLDVVKTFFDERGSLDSRYVGRTARAGGFWACCVRSPRGCRVPARARCRSRRVPRQRDDASRRRPGRVPRHRQDPARARRPD